MVRVVFGLCLCENYRGLEEYRNLARYRAESENQGHILSHALKKESMLLPNHCSFSFSFVTALSWRTAGYILWRDAHKQERSPTIGNKSLLTSNNS